MRLRATHRVAPLQQDPPPLPADESEASNQLSRAFDLYDEKKYDEAFEYCRAALRLNPDSGAGHSLLASLYEKKGNLEAAIRQMRRVIDLNPESQADKERLAHMEQRLQFLRADEEFTPPRREFSLAAFFSNPRVLSLTSLAAVILLAAFLFSDKGNQTELATTPPPPGASTSGPARSVFEPANPVQNVPSGSLFEGAETAAAPTESSAAVAPRASQPQPRPESSAPRRTETTAAPNAASQPAVQPSRTPPAPPAPPPSVRITRNPAPTAPPTTPPAVSSRTGGSDYQRMAKQAQDNGDVESAKDYYRKAIAAYRQEAGSGGGAFVAQQGIRSSELALKLLDSPE